LETPARRATSLIVGLAVRAVPLWPSFFCNAASLPGRGIGGLAHHGERL
jgi:hypothetical protein